MNRLAIKRLVTDDNKELDNVLDSATTRYPTLLPDKHEIALICTIVKISNHNFWFTTDAGYWDPSKVCKAFIEVKVLCAGGQPDVAPFWDNYSTVAENLCWLLSKISTSEYAGKKRSFYSG